MVPTISIGPLVLPTSGVVYILGAWLVLSIVERTAKELELDAEAVYALAAVFLVAAFLGARLIFVLMHWSAFQENLVGIVWPLNSGYHFWGGLFFGVLAGVFFGRYKRLPLASTMDALSPGILAGLLIISLADFLGGPGYGVETSLPWSINVFGIQRHPVQIYEILISIAALLSWGWAYRQSLPQGAMFLLSSTMYAGGRLFVDAFRANSPLTNGGYHLIQMICLVVLLVCIVLLGRLMSDNARDGVANGA